jgi:hypothetical protein
MLIHFLNEYSIIGRVGNKLKIKGNFPGMKEEDFVFLNNHEKDDEQAYKIEGVEYNEENRDNTFKATVTIDYME